MKKIKRPRYRYKLNMLAPGLIMISIMAICSLLSFIAWILHSKLFVLFFGISAVVILVVLTILIIIEGHQDKMLYMDAKKEDKDIM